MRLTAVAVAVAACGPGRGIAPRATGAGTATASTIVGPPRGAVLVVGGGVQGPEVYAKFIELAGGPDALIVDVPTAGGDSTYPADGGRAFRAAGARNVIVLHTKDRRIADSDSFAAKLANAGGVWFGGGRHYHLVDAYAGTKTQRAFEAVLARGGVVGGSSAGASILGSYLVRGAPSNNNRIMSHPDYLVGFGYLRGVAIDQHVVARERLPDLHDSVTSRRPDLLGISEDEGTAWVVRGDTGEVIGRNKAFVYNGRDANDPGKPFLTLRPGDRYNLATRRVLHRAIAESRLTQRFVDDLFARFAKDANASATVLVARNGKVYVNRAYGIPVQRRFTPETASPNFALGDISAALNASVPVADSGARFGAAFARRVAALGGLQRSQLDSATGQWKSNVDDLYRWELGRTRGRSAPRDESVVTPGFVRDTDRGMVREAAVAVAGGRRGALVRYPTQGAVIIVLTSDDSADAMGMVQRIADRMFGGR